MGEAEEGAGVTAAEAEARRGRRAAPAERMQGPLPPSCAAGGAGLTDCGACEESCCSSLEVTGGTYYRTYTNAGTGPTAEADPATWRPAAGQVPRDGRPVPPVRDAWNGGRATRRRRGRASTRTSTAGRAREQRQPRGPTRPGWVAADEAILAPTDANLACAVLGDVDDAGGANEKLPINCVNWYEAYAFCIWDGGFLPSEAEWEYAAAGGSQQREYPWGSALPGKDNRHAIYGYDNGMDCYFPSAGACTGVANIAPVGTATQGAGFAAQLDLAGEVGEWALDWFAPYVDPCVDCVYLSDSVQYRVIRGGAYDLSPSFFLPPYRGGRYPSGRNDDVGFRCARAP